MDYRKSGENNPELDGEISESFARISSKNWCDVYRHDQHVETSYLAASAKAYLAKMSTTSTTIAKSTATTLNKQFNPFSTSSFFI
ncbi:hypothetical protein PHMEG_0003995 [Phytophthora megakarya]|uniref:Uncharacterized protein n=1 Tax=Phytophthora megakarya TaxID=4795 RepID=A0A225WWM5_9STRA|nr:hypothetical protein PHMEG_0003995 [Phytophthora megakarya]